MFNNKTIKNIISNKKRYMPENHKGSRFFRYCFKHLSYGQFKIFIIIWKPIRIYIGNFWTTDWRLVIKDIAMDKKNNKNEGFRKKNLQKMTLLGSCPYDINIHRHWIYRPNITNILAFFASTEQLNALVKMKLNFLDKENMNHFLYASILSQNITSLEWGLNIGMKDNCPRGQSLLVHAMFRSHVNHCPMVECLLSYNVSWYHKNKSGESAFSLSESLPEWKRWKTKREIKNRLSNLNLDASKNNNEARERLF